MGEVIIRIMNFDKNFLKKVFMWSLTEFWRKISDAVQEEECPSAPPLSTLFGVSFFTLTFFYQDIS